MNSRAGQLLILKSKWSATQIAVLGAVLVFSTAWTEKADDHTAAKDNEKKTAAHKNSGGASSPGHNPANKVSRDDYVIGPGDVLAINVWREAEISRVVPVRPDGKISLPLVGDLEASGLTPVKLGKVLAEKLKEYFSNPEVIVIVQESRSQKFNIVGKVSRPGSYDLAKPTTMLDAIALAGGFQDFAKVTKIYILRRTADGSVKTIPFNYKAVIRGQAFDQNVHVQPDDTIVVP